MNAKRFLSLLFAAVMLVSGVFVFSACEKDEASSSIAAGEIEGDALEDVVDMPDYTWKGQEGFDQFDVLVYSQEAQTTYFSEDVEPDLYSTTDQALNEAVKKRNDEIFSKYGVTIKAVPVNDVTSELSTSALAGNNLYDAAMPFMPGAASLAQDNALYDLYEFDEYLHLDQEWWDQAANESLSIGGRLYFTTGDITIMPKVVSFAMSFNKSMFAKYFPNDNLYDMVREKKWTFDKMMEMCTIVTADTDGVAGMSEKDTWGLSSSYGDASAFYIASGNKYIGKDADDYPVLVFGENQSTITAAKAILDNLLIKDEWIFHCDVIDASTRWQVSLEIFAQNRALFRTSAFSAMKKLRQYDELEDYGIVPLPLMSETQEDYYTYCNAAYAYAVVIPNSMDENQAEWSAYILSEMAYGGKKYINTAYYETTLKTRDLRDDDSEEMLDKYVFSNIVYDLGVAFNFGNISYMLSNLMGENSSNIQSKYDTIAGTVQDDIDECLFDYGIV